MPDLVVDWNDASFPCNTVPLFWVPHISHVKTAFLSPDDPSSKLPHAVQKTKDPIAAMVLMSFLSLPQYIDRCTKVLQQGPESLQLVSKNGRCANLQAC